MPHDARNSQRPATNEDEGFAEIVATIARDIASRCVQTLLADGVIDQAHQSAMQSALEANLSTVAAHQARLRRLAELGRAAATVAHEFRNPLSVIETSAFVLSQPDVGEETRLRHAQRIAAQAASAGEIALEILQFARAEARASTSIDAGAIVEQSLRQISVPPNIAVSSSISPDLPRAMGHARTLDQVISNLVINAIEAVGESGSISIAGSVRNALVVISVRDTGGGISEVDRERIFQPWFSTKSKGTGLGLAFSRAALRSLGCDLVLANAGPPGATFEVHLPLDREAPSAGT